MRLPKLLAFAIAITTLVSTAHSETPLSLHYDTELGISANSEYINGLVTEVGEIELPKSHSGKAFKTMNKMGFDVLLDEFVKTNWVLDNFFKTSCKEGKIVLDIGGGYGNISKSAASLGARVVYNDSDHKHLIFGVSRFDDRSKSNTILNDQPLPDELRFSDQTFDAIIAHRVLHFFSPEEMELSISKFKKWLKPGGRLYIVVLSPYHVKYRDKFAKQYEDRVRSGVDWPGYPIPSKDAMPDQAYNLPENLHIMDDTPLRRVLEKNGFILEQSDFVSLKHVGIEKNRDGRESYGVIARKV